jgi:hypothetical protein
MAKKLTREAAEEQLKAGTMTRAEFRHKFGMIATPEDVALEVRDGKIIVPEHLSWQSLAGLVQMGYAVHIAISKDGKHKSETHVVFGVNDETELDGVPGMLCRLEKKPEVGGEFTRAELVAIVEKAERFVKDDGN